MQPASALEPPESGFGEVKDPESGPPADCHVMVDFAANGFYGRDPAGYCRLVVGESIAGLPTTSEQSSQLPLTVTVNRRGGHQRVPEN
jgi:hypothetical protein